MNIVINKSFGGFELSKVALKYASEKNYNYLLKKVSDSATDLVEFRCHEQLLDVVKTLGRSAESAHSKFEIVKIPDGVDVFISDYDGCEMIHENHRMWG